MFTYFPMQICCGSNLVLVQFLFSIVFLSQIVIIRDDKYTSKTRVNKIELKPNLNHNMHHKKWGSSWQNLLMGVQYIKLRYKITSSGSFVKAAT